MAEPQKFDVFAASAALPDLPPPAQSQGPTLAETTLGKVRLRFISDGAMAVPFPVWAPDAPAQEMLDLLGLQSAPAFGRGEMSAALIEIGMAQVLVDPGAGPHWQKGAGRLIKHLAANAIAPETITHLVMTHLHPDHAWGALTSAGHPAFPNAKVFIGKTETRFWSKPGLADKVNPAFRDTVEGATRLIEALRPRLTEVVEGDEVVPGLSVIDTPGHSPGHISLLLEEGPGVILTGDAVVSNLISFQRPDWPFGFDTDAETAVTSRRRLLDMAADKDHLMCGYHWNWPGIGRATREAEGYRFHPVNTL